MVLDFCEGGELYQLMQKEFKFDEEITKFITAELVLGIQDLHDAGIIYRDLKPENILIDLNGHLKLTDYGLSKNSLQGKSETNTMCGTPEYLAPEILCSESYGKSSDWYSLGCLFYEMLHGEVPFQSKNKHQMYQQRISKQIPLNQNLSFQAKELARGLLAVNVHLRNEYKDTPCNDMHYFKGFSYDKDKDVNHQTLINSYLKLI
ncbi:Protein kinase-like domain [Pseudocohnilembus persalinus]|uniref:Protein kinase-like domain n=1 Tax=Pseudocohnilembus persalinus TaxID=266149 RepID=A0A0V0QT52_PSEPJ|nr:Protein kinase-like domain [Pseudocohnilembus persalinus]|eukprot:KRX05168.1 Protein kinase-like domain [Pseudocohnilembus persalinus]